MSGTTSPSTSRSSPARTPSTPASWSRARGLRVWDIKGKEHLDAVSGGVWTVNVGYGRERIANAVRDQHPQALLLRRRRRAPSPAPSSPSA